MLKTLRALSGWIPYLIVAALAIALIGPSSRWAMAVTLLAALLGILVFVAPAAFDVLTTWRTRRGLPQRGYWRDYPVTPYDWPRLLSLVIAIAALYPPSVWLAVTKHSTWPIADAWFYTGFMIVFPLLAIVVPDMIHDLWDQHRTRRRDRDLARVGVMNPYDHDQATLAAETIRRGTR